ncbi:hypothetical protein J4N45_14575 [Vibrio sp. SCSIO 43140]|uniref:hypothetical protein n=1 Tax=Vibrio sp. SCSIO 43140 TaxID=2819100 RepID=UPI002074D66A|nr:hypothetical protein [Vibrio sp. SCSIO 43140]USD58787.1 hypothetical protein J4N45_09610 [Vibrio sp. SCSIO 43140]USD59121.1 hypothetical protein J4N45_11315 [Vibrio sp. SCSIO 43140]USD59726.1 hypothetical protein J4N45_14575 [Vibrio sp. SCSIO 43140]
MKLRTTALAVALFSLPAVANDDLRVANTECAMNAFMMLEITNESQFEKAGDYFISHAFGWSNRAKMKSRIKEQIAMSRDAINAQSSIPNAAFHLEPRRAFNGRTCAERYALR